MLKSIICKFGKKISFYVNPAIIRPDPFMNKHITTVTLLILKFLGPLLLSSILEFGEQDACGFKPPKLLANSDLCPMNTFLDRPENRILLKCY